MSGGAATERGPASGGGEEPLRGPFWRALATPWMGPLLALSTALLGALLLPDLPENVPTHWGLDGRPNGWMSPVAAVAFMPVLILGTWGLLVGLARVVPTIPREGPERRALFLMMNFVFAFMALVQGLVLWSARAGSGGGVDVGRWTFPLVGGLFIAMAAVMPLLPNGGINLPGVEESSAYGGRLLRFLRADFMLGGALLVGTALLPPRTAGVVALVLIFVVSLLPLGYLAVRPPPVRPKRKDAGGPGAVGGEEG